MKYRLKDQKLQKKLDELSKGTFSELIATSGFVFAREDTSLLKLGNERFIVVLHKDDFEAVYDPDNWNNFPEVLPPIEVDMRVETNEGHGYQAWWDGTNWRTGSHNYSRSGVLKGVKRYRPWE